MNKLLRLDLAICLLALASVGVTSAATYGNTTPFETQSSHSPDYVLGVQVEIPGNLELLSFGMMYGHEEGGGVLTANAVFGLYSSDPGTGYPQTLMAVTNPVNLNAQTTYDNIPFTTSPTISAGTYWMMALYETNANPRMGLLDASSLVAYWSQPYASGMPAGAGAVITYTGQNFNYWVNGNLTTATETTTWSSLKSIY